MQRGSVIAATAAALAVTAAGLWLWDRPETGGPAASSPSSRSIAAASPASAGAPSTTAAAASAADPGLLDIQRWRGTEIDGDIHLDSSGRVIPDIALRQLFDYLLSAFGPLDLGQIEQRVGTLAEAHKLNAAQTGELRKFFSDYVGYLKAVADLHADTTDQAGLQRVYEQRRALRRGLLGNVAAEGYFAESEAQDRYVLEKIAITQDRTLTPDERERRLAAARALAPATVRESEESAAALAALSTGTEALRKQGGDPAQLQALRERTVGPEAAARLSAVDQEEAAWNQRLQAFDGARRQIESSQGLSEEDRRRQRDALIARDFTEPEARRLRAQLGLDGSAP